MDGSPTRRMRWAVALLGVYVAAQALAPAAAAENGPRAEGPAPRVVAGLPVGSGPGRLGVEEGPEEAWGVSAFAVAPDGAFWIVDGVNGKVVTLGADGALTGELPVPSPLVAPEDIAVTEEALYLMDVAAQPALVVRLGLDGEPEESWEVPDEYSAQAVTGIAVQDHPGVGDDVYLELDGSWHVPLLERGRAVPARRPPLVRSGSRVDVAASDAPAFGLRTRRAGARLVSVDWEGDHAGVVRVFERGRRTRRLQVRTEGVLGRLKPLDTDADGVEYVLVDEIAEDGSWSASYVQAFDGDAPCGVFRLPAERFATHPVHGVRVSAAGEVFCLVPGAERVTIERLAEEPAPDAGTEAAAPADRCAVDVDRAGADAGSEHADASRVYAAGWLSRAWRTAGERLLPEPAFAIWTRLDANDRAWAYVGDRWYCSSANYTRSCGDHRPAYITAPGKTYSSVPYCWGGFDLPTTFNRAMKDGKDAGDVNTSGTSKRSCTAGVDCSGFVSRLWGLGTKQSTTTLKNFSYPISRTSMKCADLYLRPGSHAIAFRYFTSTKDSAVWESTTSSSKDRVVAWTRTAKWLSDYGYETRRYRNW
ncbi:MAG: hypothetical protein IBX62_04705 [Coriobacteriia bacterium]|nr:hypothetical protein [Coriobacteriia bacterium]